MDMHRRRPNDERRATFGWRTWLWVLLLLAIIFSPLTSVLASQVTDLLAPSPAQGGAKVIAQGVAPVPESTMVWRLVEYTALPRGATPAAVMPTGFVLATDNPILISAEVASGAQPSTVFQPVARLAPGEAFFIPRGAPWQRASVTDSATRYQALELVPITEADFVTDGQVLFIGDALPLGGAPHDVDLVGQTLVAGDSTIIPDSGASVAILATDGAIDVIPSEGQRRTLRQGEGAVFHGEIEIRGGSDIAGVGGRLLFTFQGNNDDAVFVAAVIGPEIPPPTDADMPTLPPTSTLPPLPTPSPTTPPFVTVEPTALPTDIIIPSPTSPPPSTSTPLPVATATWTPVLDAISTPTSVVVIDSDQDGLMDAEEQRLGTDPLAPDTDGDGLLDGEEVRTYGTSPLNPDTDGDQVGDGVEVQQGTDPLDPRDSGVMG